MKIMFCMHLLILCSLSYRVCSYNEYLPIFIGVSYINLIHKYLTILELKHETYNNNSKTLI